MQSSNFVQLIDVHRINILWLVVVSNVAMAIVLLWAIMPHCPNTYQPIHQRMKYFHRKISLNRHRLCRANTFWPLEKIFHFAVSQIILDLCDLCDMINYIHHSFFYHLQNAIIVSQLNWQSHALPNAGSKAIWQHRYSRIEAHCAASISPKARHDLSMAPNIKWLSQIHTIWATIYAKSNWIGPMKWMCSSHDRCAYSGATIICMWSQLWSRPCKCHLESKNQFTTIIIFFTTKTFIITFFPFSFSCLQKTKHRIFTSSVFAKTWICRYCQSRFIRILW